MFFPSGIVHTGYDALPGSIEWQCLKTSQQLNQQYYRKFNIPYKQIGAMIVAWDEKQVGLNLCPPHTHTPHTRAPEPRPESQLALEGAVHNNEQAQPFIK